MICNFGLFVVQTYLGHVFTVKQRIESCRAVVGEMCADQFIVISSSVGFGEILTSLNALPKSALKKHRLPKPKCQVYFRT